MAAEPILAGELGWPRARRRGNGCSSAFRRSASNSQAARPDDPVRPRPLPFRSAASRRDRAGPCSRPPRRIVDPLLSTGFPLTLLGVERLAAAIRDAWGDRSFDARLVEYEAVTLFEADTAALLVSALYATFHDFPVFAALTTLYFAAASYAEAARRLGRPELSGSFLSGNHPVFGPALAACCRMALSRDPGRRDELLASIRQAIEPFDVIGLSDASRRNWYPVDAADLLAGAQKLGATQGEIRELLRLSGAFPALPGPDAGNYPD